MLAWPLPDAALLMSGAPGGAPTILIENGCCTNGGKSLNALTKPVKVPKRCGTPEMTPVNVFSTKPSGSVAASRA